MNSVSKLKVAAGYALLLAILVFSLLFVRREMETLTLSDNNDVQWLDSLLVLLEEKDNNTLMMLRTITEASDSLISASVIENIMASEPDTFVVRQRIQQRVVTHSDTVVTRPQKKGFFRRLGEAFVPPKNDSAVQVKTSTELTTDTIIEPYNPIDSLQARLQAAAEEQREIGKQLQRRKLSLQKMNRDLTARIDTMLRHYERETLLRARAEALNRQEVRLRSARTIGGIAAGGVLLASIFLAMILRDIARSNRYRRELEEAHRRAENLLATREKMMLAITHDFKAPLGSIIGYADLLSRLTVDGRQLFYLDNMKASSEHLLKLVTDLLDFHRLDLNKAEVNRVCFHPARLLEEIRVSFEPLTAAKGLVLNCFISPALQGAYVNDPLRLKQIINNLLSNAVKFTDRGSVSLYAGYEGTSLVISIADTGRGMAQSDCERIFQEFTRLPGAQGKEGFGLGLSIVRMLVQLLNGTIRVDSTPGKGSTFTVRLPLEKADIDDKQRMAGGEPDAKYEKAGHAKKKNFPPHHSHNRPLLLIDDDRIQLMLTAAMLNQSGIETVTCLQVDELFDALRSSTEFGALLTDVQMPAVSGFELLKLLRASNIMQARTIPVIAVTARSDMQREEFTSRGFAGCLHKPFTVQELLDELAYDTSPAPPVTSAFKERQLNFAALTTFSGDDTDAASAIIESFISETRLNVERLQTALDAADTERVANVAHKMLPLFTMIGASELVDALRTLETARGQVFDENLQEKGRTVIRLTEEVLRLAPRKESR